ncbi:MAG: PRC-barrel domain-containing protein [Sphingomonadales bacterium]
MGTHTHTRLISSDRVEGTTVYNASGEKIGSIENVMIDKLSGKVAYADMSFGGFLGIGDKHHPLPWSVLNYSTEMDGYVVNIDKERLKNAPTFEANEKPKWEDEGWGKLVHSYYGATPYWM